MVIINIHNKYLSGFCLNNITFEINISDSIEGIGSLTHSLVVLDLSNNDIYCLEPVLDAVAVLPCLSSLSLVGNPCSVSIQPLK